MQDQSGSGYTVKAVTRHHGPSERFTANLADLDQSTLNVVTGEGGNFLSPYYMDQWKAWYDGTTFALPFRREGRGSCESASVDSAAGQVARVPTRAPKRYIKKKKKKKKKKCHREARRVKSAFPGSDS